MSLLPYITYKEYIVTVHNADDLASLYNDLETKGVAPLNTSLTREIKCTNRRPLSRNTSYLLADWEAAELRTDPRVKTVTLAPARLGIQPGTCSVSQTSTAWDKSSSTTPLMKNWALLRCVEGQQRLNWGGDGYQGNGTGAPAATGTISLAQTGKNVDVVICDQNGIVWNHPEFSVNADGTGGTRTIQYNWLQHNPAVKGTPESTYTYDTGEHSTHVAGTVAGNTQGWARSSNIYNIFYDTGTTTDSASYVMDYIREFHKTKPVNPQTGRKNPTIVNNSWGYSIFPLEWSMSDITAVTYRGIRYTPAAAEISYTGFSGVCNASQLLSSFTGNPENIAQRIVTVGNQSPGGKIETTPAAWTQESPTYAYLTAFEPPDAQYVVTVSGPGTLNIISNVSVAATSGGTFTLSGSIEVYDSTNALIRTVSDGPYTGPAIEYYITTSLDLTDQLYTIYYNTTAVENNVILSDYAVGMSVSVSSPAADTAQVTDLGDVSIRSSLDGLSSSITPDVGNNDDGYWSLQLPFNISYLSNSYDRVYVGTNMYLTFGSGSTIYYNIGATQPPLPKILVSAADNSIQRIYYGTEGVAPNRTFCIVIEGDAAFIGTLGSPGMKLQYTFYEASPSQIDLVIAQNNRKENVGGGFTTAQLNNWGFIAGQRIPARVASLDADLEDAYAEGIIMVGASGNGRWKHDLPGGLDWDNTFEMANRYPDSVIQPYYYMRGSSPTANDDVATGGDFNLPAISVGAVDSIQIDQKVLYSDCGPGVDIWAPGTDIVSSVPSGVPDPRSNSFYIGKFNGTSMASPQVTGVLACALETYPTMNQHQAKAYILGHAKLGQLVESFDGPADGQDLQGAPNKFLYYKKEREDAGVTIPKVDCYPRPITGAVYPRTRIRRTF